MWLSLWLDFFFFLLTDSGHIPKNPLKMMNHSNMAGNVQEEEEEEGILVIHFIEQYLTLLRPLH